jgi:hypothetical protein
MLVSRLHHIRYAEANWRGAFQPHCSALYVDVTSTACIGKHRQLMRKHEWVFCCPIGLVVVVKALCPRFGGDRIVPVVQVI